VTIQERIEKRKENARRISNDIAQVRAQIKALSEKEQALLQEAIGNNEALKELREIAESNT
jgi:hypothetical protein